MKRFDYATAINQLGLGKKTPINTIDYAKIPDWVRGEDFLNLYLPFLRIVGDSREQDNWIERACAYYGIGFEWARKEQGNENLKEGDYTFKVKFDNALYDFTGKVAYERKGSASEFYGNLSAYDRASKTSKRGRIIKEFDRFNLKGYDKVVLMLEFGEKLTDLIDMKFGYYNKHGDFEIKNTFYTMYSAVMSWKQPNNKGFDIIQSNSHEQLFWQFLQDTFYFFRNHLKMECKTKKLLEKE